MASRDEKEEEHINSTTESKKSETEEESHCDEKLKESTDATTRSSTLQDASSVDPNEQKDETDTFASDLRDALSFGHTRRVTDKAASQALHTYTSEIRKRKMLDPGERMNPIKNQGHTQEERKRKTSTQFRPDADMPVERYSTHYNMRHEKRGYAIIIAYSVFGYGGPPPRDCTPGDVNICKIAFKNLNYDVRTYSNLRRVDFLATLEKVRNSDHSDCDSLVIIFMSHGGLNEKRNEEFIWTYDAMVNTKELWKRFTPEKCPTLAGKPKLFFIQSAREDFPRLAITQPDYAFIADGIKRLQKFARSEVSPYMMLDVPWWAKEKAIKKAFYEKIASHQDRPCSEAIMGEEEKRLNNAFRLFSDYAKKLEYDSMFYSSYSQRPM